MRGTRKFFGTLLLVGAPFIGWLVGALPFVSARTGIIWGAVAALIGYLLVLNIVIDGGRRGWMIFKAACMVVLGAIILGILIGAISKSWVWALVVLIAGLLIGLVLVFVATWRAAKGISNFLAPRPRVVAGSTVGPDVTGLTGTEATRPDGALRPDRRSGDRL